MAKIGQMMSLKIIYFVVLNINMNHLITNIKIMAIQGLITQADKINIQDFLHEKIEVTQKNLTNKLEFLEQTKSRKNID